MNQKTSINAAMPPARLLPASGLKRKCDCGQHTIAGGECSNCEKAGSLGASRNANRFGQFSASDAEQTQPPANTPSAEFPPAFAHDFSRVRAQAEAPGGSFPSAGRFAASAATGGLPANLFLKSRSPGVPIAGADPRALQAQLSGGQSLDSSVRMRMEKAFAHDFSDVRVHRGSTAAALSAGMNARAFTVGREVAFGADEYQPHTPFGDALIAHELAHVIQQRGAHPERASLELGAGQHDALEQEADRSAAGVAARLWGAAQ